MQQQQLTIKDIENKDFKYKTRGYDPEEVDIFLDAICDEMARQLEKIDQLQQELNNAQYRVNPQPAPQPQQPAKAAEPATDSLQEVLVAAVKFKEQLEREAQQKADALVSEAQQKADTLVAEAENRAHTQLANLNEEHDRLAQQVENLRKAAAEYREKFETMVREQQEALSRASELFEE